MSSQKSPLLFTIGHSTRGIEDFLALLNSFEIKILVDIRSLPGSRKYPHFDQEQLKNSLGANGIEYVYLKKLGGRRKPSAESTNTLWRNKSFRAYADYMGTPEFAAGAEELADIAARENTAIMCSEAVWWRCHRSMVSDFFKAKGWSVFHIMSLGKSTEHPYTSPARIVGSQVFYSEEN